MLKQVNLTVYPLSFTSQLCWFCWKRIDEQDIEIDNYRFDVQWLNESTTDKQVEETLVSHLLNQIALLQSTDWGSVAIQYKGKRLIMKTTALFSFI